MAPLGIQTDGFLNANSRFQTPSPYFFLELKRGWILVISFQNWWDSEPTIQKLMGSQEPMPMVPLFLALLMAFKGGATGVVKTKSTEL